MFKESEGSRLKTMLAVQQMKFEIIKKDILLHITLQNIDFNMVKRTMFAKTKPDIVIEVNGKAFVIRTVTSLKTINAEFTLDEPYENDMTGEKETYITTIEGNKLVTKLVINGKVTDIVMTTREFTDSGFVQTYYGKTGVTGTRTFEKA